MVMVDSIVNACIEQYDKLPKSGKPKSDEWTVISAVVGVFNNVDIKVLSLGTGSKCIGPSIMSPKGDILNDSHAEVIARRAFIKFLFIQIIQLNKTNFSEIFEKNCDNFQVKECVKFYFVTSMPPCGDASIMPKTNLDSKDDLFSSEGMDGKSLKRTYFPDGDQPKKIKIENLVSESSSHTSNETICRNNEEKRCRPDIHRTGAKCLPTSTIQDLHLPGVLYHTVGAVRTKPGRGDPTLSLSCSDKIARWNAIGWQGALLSLFLKDPLFVDGIICGGGCPFSKESFDRSVNARIGRKSFISVEQSNVSFPALKMAGKKPNPSSIIWCRGDAAVTEVSVNGRKIGVTKKNLNKKTARVSICKKEVFLLFQSVVNTLPHREKFIKNLTGDSDGEALRSLTYAETKLKAEKYQSEWDFFKNKYFKVWSDKPVGLLNFTLKDDI